MPELRLVEQLLSAAVLVLVDFRASIYILSCLISDRRD